MSGDAPAEPALAPATSLSASEFFDVCPGWRAARSDSFRRTLNRVCAIEYDSDKVDEMVLALPFLTRFDEDQYGARAWKGHDWDRVDRLHEKGDISDPKSKAKSVVVTVKGVKRSRELFEKNFGKKEPDAPPR
jgi:Domain of unknown function (DUF6429)